MGENKDKNLGNGSVASSASSTRGDKYLIESVGGTSGAEEGSGEWQKLTWCHVKQGGRKARSRQQGGTVNGQATEMAQTRRSGTYRLMETAPARHGDSVQGMGMARTGRWRCRWQQAEWSGEVAEGMLEAGRGGHWRAHATPYRPPPWWWQQLS